MLFVPKKATADLRAGPGHQNRSSRHMGRLLSHSATCWVSFGNDVAPSRPKIAHFSLLFLLIIFHGIVYQKLPQRTKDPAPCTIVDRLDLWEGRWVILRCAESRFGAMSLLPGRKSLIFHNFLTDNFARYCLPKMNAEDQRSSPLHQNRSSRPMGRLLSHSATFWVSISSDVAPPSPKIAQFSLFILMIIFHGISLLIMTTAVQRSGPLYQNRSSWHMGRLLSHSATFLVSIWSDVAPPVLKIAHFRYFFYWYFFTLFLY